jgi:hypothetical protein
MPEVRVESGTTDDKPINSESRGVTRFPWWFLLGALGLSVIVGWCSPTQGTFLFLGGALLLLGLVLALQRLAATSRLLSIRVRPEVVLAIVTCCLVLAAFEIILRLLFFQNFPDFGRMSRVSLEYDYDSTLGWFPVPNSQKNLDVGRRTISIAHNSKGFRDPEPMRDDRPRIVFLGDSFVWGYELDASDRFTEKLRARHPDWQIYNFGVVGYGTDQEYLLLQKHFKEYQPRLVFLIFCTNDRADNSGNGRSDWAFKPYFTAGPQGPKLHGVPVPRSDWLFCLHHPILSKPYIVRLTMRAWGNLRSPPPKSKGDPTTQILQALHRYVEDRGAMFCVGLTGKDKELEQFLTDSKIPHVDLTTDLLIEGDWHWSAEGNSFVAEKLDRFLVDGKFVSALQNTNQSLAKPGAEKKL